VFLIMFKTGHALPLTFVRLSRPRISRRQLAKSPQHGCGEAQGIGHWLVLNSGVYRSHARIRPSLNPATNAATPQPDLYPRSNRIRQPYVAANCPKCGNVRAQSAVCPHPRTSRELTRSSNHPRPPRGIIEAVSRPRSLQRSRNGAPTYGPI
jgi:hypothetical protein